MHYNFKKSKIIFISLIVLLILFLLVGVIFSLFHSEPLTFNNGNISSISIRQSSDADELILSGDSLNEFLEKFDNLEFEKKDCGSFGGWSYNIIAYGESKEQYQYSVLSEKEIAVDSCIYECKTKIDFGYLESLFNS